MEMIHCLSRIAAAIYNQPIPFVEPHLACQGPGGLQKLAALFVIALGVSTLWQGVRFYLVMYKLVL